LLRRANVGRSLRWAATAAKAGGAALGLAVVVSSPDPELVLGLLGTLLLVVGGMTWSRVGRSALPLRVVLSLATIVLARFVLGPSGAALAALLLALGVCLRIRPADAVLGVAVFGGAVAVLGGASLALVLAFWILGVALAVLRPLARRISLHLGKLPFLRVERTKPVRLGPEN
jgi:hypothetical protein